MRRVFLIFPAISSGSKIQCVVVCNFNSWCAFIFYKPIKKFEFLGASRAPRFCVSRERGSGDENAKVPCSGHAQTFFSCFQLCQILSPYQRKARRMARISLIRATFGHSHFRLRIDVSFVVTFDDQACHTTCLLIIRLLRCGHYYLYVPFWPCCWL